MLIGRFLGESFGLGNIKDEHPTWMQSVIHASKEWLEAPDGLCVKRIVQTFANRGHGPAVRKVHTQQRSGAERGFRRPSSRQSDHGWGKIYPQHVVSGSGEFPRPPPAATSEIDYQPLCDPVLAEQR